jgi:hypothetical protein
MRPRKAQPNPLIATSRLRSFGIALYRDHDPYHCDGWPKRGVGKSTLARLIAREYANADWNLKIADLDVGQGTSFNWQSRRLQQGIEPVVGRTLWHCRPGIESRWARRLTHP